MEQYKYYKIFKPYEYLSQFTSEGDKRTLKDIGEFQKDVYPVGRLDFRSEGLLILTNDNYLKTRLLEPKHGHSRTYLVQVEGIITQEAASKLRSGLHISIDGKEHVTKSALVNILEWEPKIPDRIPPIRVRKNIPTSWFELTLTEGKYHQVRKMTAQTGFPTLRLIRTKIEDLDLIGLEPGTIIEMEKEEIYKKAKISIID